MIKNKFAKWIEWLLDLLPLFAVLFSCLYVTFNKNAYESYYGETVNEIEIIYTNDLQPNTRYYIANGNVGAQTGSGYVRSNFYVTDLQVPNTTNDYSVINRVQIYINSAGNMELLCFEPSSNNIKYDLYISVNNLQPSFVLVQLTEYTSASAIFNLTDFNLIYYQTYNNYSYLNNAFIYALSQFNDLGFDKLNFVNWFTGLFLNGTSNVYTTFINGYLNYFLLVECTYVLPMVLYWFIHLGERLISKLEYGGDN